jgi:integrase
MQANRGVWIKPKSDRGLLKRGKIWYIRYRANGKTRSEAVGPSKAYALKALEKRRTQARDGKFFPDLVKKNVSFTEIIDDAIARAKDAHAVKRPDRKFREGNYGRVKLWFSDRTAASLTPQELAAKLHEVCKTKATFNRYRVALSHAYKLAIENKKAVENPANLVKLQQENNERVRYFNQYDENEETNLRAAIRAKYPKREPELDLALHTGLRADEQRQLTWADVDLRLNLITLRETKAGKKQRVPLNADAKLALAKLRAQAPKSEHVCPDRTDFRRRWWDEIRKDAGTVDFLWHDLRHTFASRLVMAGVDILTVNKLLRHKTLQVTMRYAHLAETRLHEAVAKLELGSVQEVLQPAASQPVTIH